MEPHPSAITAMGSGEASSSSTIPLMSPEKQARFSELVSIITTSAQALQDEFDWVSTTTWTQILDQMFPATGGVVNLAGNDLHLKRLLDTVKASEAKKAGSKIFKNDPPPPADADARTLTSDQRTTEWSLIMRFGDPRAPMNDEHFAYVAIALKRWWRCAASVSLLKKARQAVVAQYRLVGHFGPGMLPFNTAVWQKASYDAQCDFLRELRRAGNAKGVLALESFLGKTTRDDDVVVVRETKRSPTGAGVMTDVQVSNVRETKCNPLDARKITGAQKLEARETRKRSKEDAKETEQVEISDSDSDIPASKRQKTAMSSKPAPQVVEIDSDNEPIQKERTQLRLVVKPHPKAEKSLIVKLPIKSSNSVPTKARSDPAAPNNPLPQAVPTKQAPAQVPKGPYRYKVEAELTSSPRTNALISHIISSFAVQHRKLLTRSPWALEKVRRYAQGKEPHIKGPGQTSMLEIGFFEGKDLSWSISGFQLDRLTDIREKAKVEWEARQAEKLTQELAEVRDNTQSNKDENSSGVATQTSDNILQSSVQTDLNDNNRPTTGEAENGDNEAVEPKEHESRSGIVTVDATDNQVHGGTDGIQTEPETSQSPVAGHEDVLVDAHDDMEEQVGSPVIDEDVHMHSREDEHASSHDDDSANGEDAQFDTDKQHDGDGTERSYSSSGSGTDSARSRVVSSPVLTEEQIQTLQLFWGERARQQRRDEEARSSSVSHANTSAAHSSAASSANTEEEHTSSHGYNAADASDDEGAHEHDNTSGRSYSDHSNYGSDAASNDEADTEMQLETTPLDHDHNAMHTFDGNAEQDHQMQLLRATAADENAAHDGNSNGSNTKGLFGWLWS